MIPIIISVSNFEELDELADQITYDYYARTSASAQVPITRSRKIDTNAKVKPLNYRSSISQGAPKSLEILDDNSDYTVTTGKTAKLILVIESNSANVRFNVYESSSADTASGTIKYSISDNGIDAGVKFTVCPELDDTELTFATGKYITIDVTSTGDSLDVLSAVVIES